MSQIVVCWFDYSKPFEQYMILWYNFIFVSMNYKIILIINSFVFFKKINLVFLVYCAVREKR